ncbi:hypothetical protein VCSRO51_2632 [Vibrio cholerae]|nr:hypothetical protein VCSRO51_2632 [Vibrio cholerae]GHZ17631.1 hypothetical protein VCSRO78_2516 [Vibrio cholerae]
MLFAIRLNVQLAHIPVQGIRATAPHTLPDQRISPYTCDLAFILFSKRQKLGFVQPQSCNHPIGLSVNRAANQYTQG